MKVKWADIENAFEFVSLGNQYETQAFLNPQTGEFYYKSEISGTDERPEECEAEWDSYISIPHKNEIELGRNLVYEFAAACIPEHEEAVRRFFKERGAYAQFKELLTRIDKLQAWYDYENKRTTDELRRWCQENHVAYE